MKRIHILSAVVSIAVLGLVGFGVRSEGDPLAEGTVLQRTDIAGGQEAILVLRELPAGAESGSHTNPGGEIVYILEGSVIVEKNGKPPVTVEQGAAFQTMGGEMHNVKNASSTTPGKALAFYIAKKGTPIEKLSVPSE